jgi:predicted MPP superfamily phosphohydrolase
MSTTALLAGFAAAGAFVVRGTHRHRTFFEQTQTEVVIKGLHPKHDGLRIAQLSDIHIGLSTPAARIRAAVEAVNAAGVDLVALTGDYVTRSMRPIPLISKLLSGLKAPVFAVLGNHDHWVDAEGVTGHLKRVGCTVLRNEHAFMILRGASLCVIGIDDERSGNDDVEAAFKGSPKSGSRLVLTHTPPTVRQLPHDAGLLCLTGHTHGGQIKLPGITQRLLHRMGQPYERGLHRVNGNYVYVNRGLGYGIGGAALRVGSKPEVSYFTLRKDLR